MDEVPEWLREAWRLLGRWEREALRMIVERILEGQWTYGAYDPETDERCMVREASEEMADLCVYRAFRRLLR